MNEKEKPTSLTATQAHADTDYFFETLESVHPHILFSLPVNEYMGLKKGIKEQLIKIEEADGHIPTARLAFSLAQIAARLGDGHTRLLPQTTFLHEKDLSKIMLPFRLELEKGQLVG